MTRASATVTWASLRDAGITHGEMPVPDDAATPWYVRVMMGAGGVLGALFLVGFFAAGGLIFILESGALALLFGLCFCAGAVTVYLRRRENDFYAQFAFTLSLAGQIMILIGLSRLMGSNEVAVAACMILVQAGLFQLVPDFQHRVWSAGAGAFALTYIFNKTGFQVSEPLLLALAALVWLNEFRDAKHAGRMRALGYGLVLILFYQSFMVGNLGIIMRDLFRGTAYAVTDWRLWLQVILFGIVLLGSVGTLMKRNGMELHSTRAHRIFTGIVLLTIIAVKLPGVLTGVTILVIGFAHGNRVLAGLALAASLFYLSAYYYSLEMTLLEKSAVLTVTGLVLLGVRYGLRQWLDDRMEDTGHA